MRKIDKKLKTKMDIVAEMAKTAKLPIPTACLFVDTVFKEISHALLKNKRVEIRGFGTFGVKKYKAYKGRNPKTQQKIMVRAKKRPWFKPGQLKKTLNSRP